MSKRKPTRPTGRCKATGLLCYIDQTSAAITLGKLRDKRGRRGHMESRVFYCCNCQRFHLTSRSGAEL